MKLQQQEIYPISKLLPIVELTNAIELNSNLVGLFYVVDHFDTRIPNSLVTYTLSPLLIPKDVGANVFT